MVAAVGYVIAGLTLFVGIFITLFRRVDDTLLKARSTIKQEFILAYREFGDTAAAEGTDSARLDMCVKRLRCLHYSSLWDFLKLKAIEWVLGLTVKLIICVIILVALSIVIGIFVLNENQSKLRFVFVIGIPFILFIGEMAFLGWILKRESYLNRVINRYKNLEYQV